MGRQVPRVMVQEVVKQEPRVMVQEVVRQVQAPAPVVMQAPQIIETVAPMPMPMPVVETVAPMPMTTMAAPMPMTTMAAPMPMAAPMVGSISASLPMTTMAAPMTSFGTTTMGGGYGMSPTIL